MHDTKKELPPSRINTAGGLTWAAVILPYMEEANLGRLVNFTKNFNDQPVEFRQTPIPTYWCPSRERDQPLSITPGQDIPYLPPAPSGAIARGVGSAVGVRGDYACITGTWRESGGGFEQYFDGSIIAPVVNATTKKYKSRTSFKKITDGLSKTFLVAENSYFMSARCSIYDGNDNPGAFLGLGDFENRVKPIFQRGMTAPDKNKIQGSDISFSQTQWESVDPRIDHKGYSWFGGDHTSVINVTLADGSSRAITKDADLATLEALVTRQGEEVVNMDAL
jgi:hypothetical protein